MSKENKIDIQEVIKKYSQMQSLSEAKDLLVQLYASAIERVFNEYFPDRKKPIFAGGIVRDVIFGTATNDIDVWFNLDDFESPEDFDDFVVFLSERMKELTEDNSFAEKTENLNTTYQIGVGEQGIAIWNFWTTNDITRAVPCVQFIARPGCPEITDDPLKFVSGFDYSLVKGWYDIEERQYYVLPEFFTCADKKLIEVPNTRSHTRAEGWRYRLIDYTKWKVKISGTPAKVPKQETPKSPFQSIRVLKSR